VTIVLSTLHQIMRAWRTGVRAWLPTKTCELSSNRRLPLRKTDSLTCALSDHALGCRRAAPNSCPAIVRR
jgi:hypothetical protein